MSRFGFFTRLFVVAVVLIASFSLQAKAQQTSFTQAASKQTGGDSTSLEKETFSLINEYRKAHDLPVLKWSDQIVQVARSHSKDMATGVVDFGHEGFSQRAVLLRADMVGANGVGENVFMAEGNSDQETVQLAVTTWLHSPHHLANIRGDFNYSGVGISKAQDGTLYFTQIFVKIQPRAQPVTDVPPLKVISPFNYLADPKTR
jgi:uncharacterized protein YkwD